MFSAPIPPPPTTLTASKLGWETNTPRPGTRLTAGEIGYPRVFSNRHDGLAIGGSQEGGGVTFAAITTDGGRIWTVGSPALFTASADAPNAVTSIATVGTHTDIVYGPECIDVSPDGGRTWYRAYPPGWVTAVVPGLHGIAAYDQITNAAGTVTSTVQYVSTDGGRRWRLSDELGG